MSRTSRIWQNQFRWHRFWRYHPLGRALQLAAACFPGGAWVGGLIGYSNSFSNPPGVGPPLWEWVGFTAFACGTSLFVAELMMAWVLFACVAVAESRWNAPRRWRFARALPLQMLLPVLTNLFLSPLLAAPWIVAALRNGSDVGDVLVRAGLLALIAASLLWIWVPVFSSRRRKRSGPRVRSRLLPAR